MRRTYSTIFLLAGLLSCSSGGGSSSSPGGSGFLSIEVTDAPIDPSIVEEARLAVDKITVHEDAGAESGFITIYEGAPLDFNLFELRNGVTRGLVLARLDAGSYGQVRLFVESAYLRLTNGNEYRTSDNTLELPGQPAGLKVNIDPPVEITGGTSRTLVLDFDLTRSFRPVPGNDPMGANQYHLHPVIRAANMSNSGEIRGLVTQDDGAGGSLPVETATVRVFLPGETDEDASVAATMTEENGSYAFIGLRPGTYDLRASKEELEGTLEGVAVSVGSATLADIRIE